MLPPHAESPALTLEELCQPHFQFVNVQEPCCTSVALQMCIVQGPVDCGRSSPQPYGDVFFSLKSYLTYEPTETESLPEGLGGKDLVGLGLGLRTPRQCTHWYPQLERLQRWPRGQAIHPDRVCVASPRAAEVSELPMQSDT